MKTSPPPPPPASISCSSSSSSSSASAPNQITKPKVKRSKKKNNSEKRHYGNSSGRRSSMYRGVTRHRWTGRYEAHLWDKNSWNPVQNKKGRQVYLGAYDDEEAAAHTYDLAALKYWGPDTILNFPLSTYTNEFAEMQKVTKEEYLASLRRRSSGFSRGVSKYRGVARHHHNGRWEARIGRVYGNKYLYLGTYSTQEEAAAAYDLAAIEYRGVNAVTNFDISHYIRNPPPIQVPSSPTPPPPPPPPQPPTFHEPPEAPPQIHLPENADPIDQTAVVDPLTEPPWDVCMDTAYSPMPVSDIAIGRTNELHDLFNGYGFEENIEYLFEASEATGGSFEGEGWGNDLKVDGIFENSAEFDDDFLNGVDDGKDCGLIEEILTSAAAAADSSSYPPPISICS